MEQVGHRDEFVTLVDPQDNVVGAEEKLQAHREGKLHRAFSIFVFDGRGRLLIQRRSAAKYHSAGLWSNTCCGHPRPGESLARAASRRLVEEMGFGCELIPAFRLLYKARLGTLIEHELDHVFVGRFSGTPAPDPLEVDEFVWSPLERLRQEIAAAPAAFTCWLRLLLDSPDWAAVDAILAKRL